MSHVLILSADIKMPEFYGVEGFTIKMSYYGRGCLEFDRFVKKEYYYSIYISTDTLALSKLKEYLLKNMKPDSEIELWSLWLGGDLSKHYHTMPKISNISDINLKDIEDSIDYYTETHFSPIIRKASVCGLSLNDIAFINSQSGCCLIVSN